MQLRSIITTFALLGLVGISNALATEWVVLESNSADVSAGSVFAENDSIKLKQGQALTLLSSDGDSRTVTGPLKLDLSAMAGKGEKASVSTVSLALNRLVAAKSLDGSQTGTVRALSPAFFVDETPTWAKTTSQVLVTPHSVQCISAGAKVALKRADTAATDARVKQVGGSTVYLTWADNQTEQAWPTAISLQDNALYLINQAGKLVPADVRIRLLPASMAGAVPQFQVAKLASLGCVDQARLMAAGVASETSLP